jgi:hypothetical protein
MPTKLFFGILLCSGNLFTMPDFLPTPFTGQSFKQAPVGRVFRKKLPDDLPQEKILFVRYSPVTLPTQVPKMFTAERGQYSLKKNHNEVIPEANEQLVKMSAEYPYTYRITTLDSVGYYQARGYKYMLMQSSFNSAIDGTYLGTRGSGMGANRTYTSTSVDLYVQNLQNGDKYVFNDFSQTFIYYYKGQVGMLLKQVNKQFKPKG